MFQQGCHRGRARGLDEQLRPFQSVQQRPRQRIVVEFVAAVQEEREPYVGGRDARRALAVALACADSVRAHAPVAVDAGPAGA